MSRMATLLLSGAALAEEAAGSGVLAVSFSVLENSAVDAVSSASRTGSDGEWVGVLSVLANQIRGSTSGDLCLLDMLTLRRILPRNSCGFQAFSALSFATLDSFSRRFPSRARRGGWPVRPF